MKPRNTITITPKRHARHWNCPPQPLRCAATVGCAAGFSHNGIHSSYRSGGLLRSVSVLWRDRKLDDAHMPKEVTRKSYFRHSAGQSSSLLVSFGNQRSRGNHTGSKRTTRHARARPPLRTPPLCDTSESRHLCQRTFEDSHTSHRLHHSTPQSERHLYSNVFWNSPPTFPVGVRRRKAIGCGL